MYEKDLHNIVLKHCIFVIPLFVAHVCFSAIASDVCDGNPPENSNATLHARGVCACIDSTVSQCDFKGVSRGHKINKHNMLVAELYTQLQ